MSQANWPVLQQLLLGKHIQYLGDNQIGDQGCHHLSRTSWPALQTLGLCKHIQYVASNQIGD